MNDLSGFFSNVPPGSYKPLAFKYPVIENRLITKGGIANAQEFFFITKGNTIKERATLDLLYPTPLWLKRLLKTQAVNTFDRITPEGYTRITPDGFLRVVKEYV